MSKKSNQTEEPTTTPAEELLTGVEGEENVNVTPVEPEAPVVDEPEQEPEAPTEPDEEQKAREQAEAEAKAREAAEAEAARLKAEAEAKANLILSRSLTQSLQQAIFVFLALLLKEKQSNVFSFLHFVHIFFIFLNLV